MIFANFANRCHIWMSKPTYFRVGTAISFRQFVRNLCDALNDLCYFGHTAQLEAMESLHRDIDDLHAKLLKATEDRERLSIMKEITNRANAFSKESDAVQRDELALFKPEAEKFKKLLIDRYDSLRVEDRKRCDRVTQLLNDNDTSSDAMEAVERVAEIVKDTSFMPSFERYAAAAQISSSIKAMDEAVKNAPRIADRNEARVEQLEDENKKLMKAVEARDKEIARLKDQLEKEKQARESDKKQVLQERAKANKEKMDLDRKNRLMEKKIKDLMDNFQKVMELVRQIKKAIYPNSV